MAFNVDNKKIAKNTFFLYLRQILIMLIALYTSRVILNALGAEDYGIYSVVGGFVAMFNVISGAFTVAISRFMQYVIGEGDEEKLERLFSTALVVQSATGLLICLLLATGGVWYVNNVMVLPVGRTQAALWVLLFSAITFFVKLISVPYDALIVAHEQIAAYAYIAILEAGMKLGVALAIQISPFDKLISYGFLMLLAQVIVRACYSIYCKRHFTGCRFSLRIHRTMLQQMLTFVGWAFLGNGAGTLRDQGTTMIMNLFGGTIINAARGIAQNMNGAVSAFANYFMQATQPQITKLWATGQREEMRRLIYRSCRISYFLMALICIPLIKNMDMVLHIWLGTTLDYTREFAIMTLVRIMITALGNPLIYGVFAVGEIKVYEVCLSTLCILTLPVSYLLLSVGLSPVSVYLLQVVFEFLILLLLIWQSKTYGLTFGAFIVQVGARVVLVTVFCVVIAMFTNLSIIPFELLRFVLESGIIVVLNAMIILFFGFTTQERTKLIATVLAKFKKSASHGM